VTFRQLLQTVAAATRLNPGFFAETVTSVSGSTTTTPAAHVRYRRREIRDERTGDARTVDEIRVEILKTALPAGPALDDRITRAGESRSYVYAAAGGETTVSWKATFRREVVTGQRGRK
jgi:hypothetical protein